MKILHFATGLRRVRVRSMYITTSYRNHNCLKFSNFFNRCEILKSFWPNCSELTEMQIWAPICDSFLRLKTRLRSLSDSPPELTNRSSMIKLVANQEFIVSGSGDLFTCTVYNAGSYD